MSRYFVDRALRGPNEETNSQDRLVTAQRMKIGELKFASDEQIPWLLLILRGQGFSRPE